MAKSNSKHNSKLKPVKLVGNTKYQTIAAIVVIVAAAILGYFLFIASHASTPFVSIEAESGTLDSGNIATKITDSTASGGTAVQFGALPSTGNGSGNQYCGFTPGTHPSKVMIIWEENLNYTQIIGQSSGPFINTLANDCALATNYNDIGHPSLPNYMATTAGAVNYNGSPWNGDCDPTTSGCTTSANSIFQQVGAGAWKGYVEDMSGNCGQSSSGEYAAKHNPAVYFTNITSQCNSQDIPIPPSNGASGAVTNSGQLASDVSNGTLPTLSTVTPNLNDDGHDTSLSNINSWLNSWIPVMIAGPDYKSGKLAILIAWDEAESGTGDHTVVIGMTAGMPVTATTGIKDGTSYNDLSITSTVDQIAGKSNLSGATSMNTGFKF